MIENNAVTSIRNQNAKRNLKINFLYSKNWRKKKGNKLEENILFNIIISK